MADRTLRTEESREATKRKVTWTRPNSIPDPEPKPGVEYRWIRTSTLGQADMTNVSSKFREGWEPVRADMHPEIFADAVSDDRFKDNIVIGGLMLCKAPQEMVDDRNEYYKQQTAAQMQSVDHNLMRESDPRMPIFNDRKSSVTFGKG